MIFQETNRHSNDKLRNENSHEETQKQVLKSSELFHYHNTQHEKDNKSLDESKQTTEISKEIGAIPKKTKKAPETYEKGTDDKSIKDNKQANEIYKLHEAIPIEIQKGSEIYEPMKAIEKNAPERNAFFKATEGFYILYTHIFFTDLHRFF